MIHNRSSMVIALNNKVVNAWKEVELSRDPPPKSKNYQELNKVAIKGGAITAKVTKSTYFRISNSSAKLTI